MFSGKVFFFVQQYPTRPALHVKITKLIPVFPLSSIFAVSQSTTVWFLTSAFTMKFFSQEEIQWDIYRKKVRYTWFVTSV